MSSTTGKTQFKLPEQGNKNLKVEAKKLADDKASYTWLVGTQTQQREGNNKFIYNNVSEKSALMAWLQSHGVPSDKGSGNDLLSYSQHGDRPISIHDFIVALTFSFSDPWGTPATSAAVTPTASEAVTPPLQNVDILQIQAELLRLLKSRQENPSTKTLSCLLLTIAVQLALLFNIDPQAKSVPWKDNRLVQVRRLWHQFEVLFQLRDSRLHDVNQTATQNIRESQSAHIPQHTIPSDVFAINQELLHDFSSLKAILQPLLESTAS